MLKQIELSKLDNADKELLLKAKEVRQNAYAPYSLYKVGAALRAHDGRIFTGANVENASYGLTSCAEVGAIQSALSAGYTSFKKIAIVVSSHQNAGSPCGRCRQVIYETGTLSQTDIEVLLANDDLSIVEIASISELLPRPFGPIDLPESKHSK